MKTQYLLYALLTFIGSYVSVCFTLYRVIGVSDAASAVMSFGIAVLATAAFLAALARTKLSP